MLETLNRIFSGSAKESGEDLEHRLQLVTAALFIEMCKADTDIASEEIETTVDAIRRTFVLSDIEAKDIVTLARSEADTAISLYEFTSQVNQHFSPPEKLKLIENLWRIAYADSTLDKHEEYLVRKVSDLIHVSHKDFIRAKLRVTGD